LTAYAHFDSKSIGATSHQRYTGTRAVTESAILDLQCTCSQYKIHEENGIILLVAKQDITPKADISFVLHI